MSSWAVVLGAEKKKMFGLFIRVLGAHGVHLVVLYGLK